MSPTAGLCNGPPGVLEPGYRVSGGEGGAASCAKQGRCRCGEPQRQSRPRTRAPSRAAAIAATEEAALEHFAEFAKQRRDRLEPAQLTARAELGADWAR